MLIYANRFLFEPAQGPDQIIQLVARWVGSEQKVTLMLLDWPRVSACCG